MSGNSLTEKFISCVCGCDKPLRATISGGNPPTGKLGFGKNGDSFSRSDLSKILEGLSSEMKKINPNGYRNYQLKRAARFCELGLNACGVRIPKNTYPELGL
jgi:hypothetical protein